MGTRRGLMKGVLPWLNRWTRNDGTIDFCPALAAVVNTVQNIISSPYTFSLKLSPSPSWAGGRAGSPVSMSLSVHLHLPPAITLFDSLQFLYSALSLFIRLFSLLSSSLFPLLPSILIFFSQSLSLPCGTLFVWPWCWARTQAAAFTARRALAT